MLTPPTSEARKVVCYFALRKNIAPPPLAHVFMTKSFIR